MQILSNFGGVTSPIPFMYGIFTYMLVDFYVGKYTTHWMLWVTSLQHTWHRRCQADLFFYMYKSSIFSIFPSKPKHWWFEDV